MEGAPAQYAPDVLGAECIRVNECSAGRFIHGWDMQPTFLSDQDLLELGFEDLSQAADALDAHQHSELKHDGSFLVQAKHLSEQAPYRNDSDIHQGHHRSASLPRDVRHGSDMHGQQSLTVHDGRPSNDTIRGVEDSMRISCATAAAVHGALAEGVAFDLPNVGNINSSVLRSTVVQHSTAIISATPSEQMAIAASALENVTSDSYINVGGTTKRWVYQDNELNTNTKKRMKLAQNAGSPDNRSSGSATDKPSSAPAEKLDVKVRSSQYRGVTKHKRSGRWEAHIWVKETGKQMYLGGYEKEEHAAEAYDVAAIKCKGGKVGRKVKLNFPASKYSELSGYMESVSLEELVMAVRRQSQGFARGSSGYRGVTHHPNGRWEARIGMPGSKHIYLGLYNEESAAARAYDRALVRLRGPGVN